ncbi:alpha-amylase 1 [Cryptotermes secundus]|uniref:alpha-amylase 1 n=1 Tax=Cryptotermes secundus TaxID=105785 RepID=UPI001454D362|nr:alpha-amylase 1 [Cryptotermes secundus]
MLLLSCVLVALLCAAGGQKDPNVASDRSAIVHIFEWKFDDIAAECEKFLAPQGYAGVQVSPINEVIILNVTNRPWYDRYQPISYRITSRSGDEVAFRSMVHRCNHFIVRIYVDVVMNHMSANSGDVTGTGNSRAYTADFVYPAVPTALETFTIQPAAFRAMTMGTMLLNLDVKCLRWLREHPSTLHYVVLDAQLTRTISGAHAQTGIRAQVRESELSGPHDFSQTTQDVREQIIDFLNYLVDAGIAGFRVDAAKHMWPQDLQYIYSHVKNLSTVHGFPPQTRPLIYQEVIVYGGEAVKRGEYTSLGRVTEFNYGTYLGQGFAGDFPISHFYNFGSEWGMLDGGDALVVVDNHEYQRGSGGGERTFSPINKQNCTRLNVPGTSVTNWWDNGSQQIAYTRGNLDFIAFNDQYNTDLNQTIQVGGQWPNYIATQKRNKITSEDSTENIPPHCDVPLYDCHPFGWSVLQTSLPGGTYFDVISGEKQGSFCTGKIVSVEPDGTAFIQLPASENDGVLAITVEVCAYKHFALTYINKPPDSRIP